MYITLHVALQLSVNTDYIFQEGGEETKGGLKQKVF